MKGTRFKAASSIQQTLMRELKAIWEEAFSWEFDLLYERYKHYAEVGGGGTILSDSINKYFLSFFFFGFLWP
jgi:hypothetical protein